jgi:DNA-binding response OmpR family regulator
MKTHLFQIQFMSTIAENDQFMTVRSTSKDQAEKEFSAEYPDFIILDVLPL